MAMVQVSHLRKTYKPRRRNDAPVVAVDDVTFSAEEGTFLTLLGPSGCGKTTTLRSIAGLERPDAGAIEVGGRTLYSSETKVDVPANRRALGMVFQSYAIWPHMNVYENVAFPLTAKPRRERIPRSVIRERVEHVLDVVQLGDLGNRPATDLSGGQQQRLALARALVRQPAMLLLDEPLSNLDAKLREQLRFELKRLQRELGVTTLYVTHDQAEALSMSNVLAVMDGGEIQQMGRPRDVYERPTSKFVADFIGTSNFIAGKVDGPKSGDVYPIWTAAGPLGATSTASVAKGAEVTLAIRPEHIKVSEGAQMNPGSGVWVGRIRDRAFLGEALDYIVVVEETLVRVRCNASLNFPTGTEVTLVLPSEFCTLLPGT